MLIVKHSNIARSKWETRSVSTIKRQSLVVSEHHSNPLIFHVWDHGIHATLQNLFYSPSIYVMEVVSYWWKYHPFEGLQSIPSEGHTVIYWTLRIYHNLFNACLLRWPLSYFPFFPIKIPLRWNIFAYANFVRCPDFPLG